MQALGVQVDLPARAGAGVAPVPERLVPIGRPGNSLVEREQRPPAQKRAGARGVERELRRLVRMLGGVKTPSGTPVPTDGKCLNQIRDRTKARRVGREIE